MTNWTLLNNFSYTNKKGKITISDSGREIREIHMYTLHLTPILLYLIIAV